MVSTADKNLSVDELRIISDDLLDLSRALSIGADELMTRHLIDSNESRGITRIIPRISDLFEIIKLRSFTTIVTDLGNSANCLKNTINKAAIVVEDPSDTDDVINISTSLFNLFDELLEAFQTDRSAAIAQFIDQIDSYTESASILADSPSLLRAIRPSASHVLSTANDGLNNVTLRTNISGQKIIQDVDISRQRYYEFTPRRLAILDLIAYAEGTDREIGNTKKVTILFIALRLFQITLIIHAE